MSAPAWAGAPIGNPAQGWSSTAPDGWQAVQQDGAWVLVPQGEAGAVMVSFLAGATLSQLQDEGQRGLNEQGLRLSPTGAPSAFTATGGAAFQQDFQGGAADGSSLAAHVVAVVGAPGGVIVLGITTPELLPSLSIQVDTVARGVRYSAPKLPVAKGKLADLNGALCRFSGGSGYAATQRLSFDGIGGVSWDSSFAAGGSFQDSSGDYAGGWSSVSGDQTQPSDRGVYSFDGAALHIAWADGSTRDCTAAGAQAGGRVTELKCGDKLFAAGLCG
jgi:hypothetical protein